MPSQRKSVEARSIQPKSIEPKSIEPMFVGRTFDDFLLRPFESVVGSRRSVSVASRLTASIRLELPVVSANMDSVTAGAMAKAMALAGGLGFVHRGMSIAAQVREVES